MSPSNKVIWAIDFDGVIHEPTNRVKGYKMGRPVDGARNALLRLRENDHEIIIHSARALVPSGMKSIEDWMQYFEIPYDYIIEKPIANFYVDDRAITFRGWSRIGQLPT